MTEIASAMSEITYILEEMKDMPDTDESNPFKSVDNYDDDAPNVQLDLGGNLPATVSELKELISKFLKKIIY